MELRSILRSMNKLNLVHKILISRYAVKNGMYFGQFPILEYVIENDGCAQKDIADFLNITPPSITNSIKRMQKTGLLRKYPDETDMRITRISATEKGIEIFRTCKNEFNLIDKKMFDGFSEDELNILNGFFTRMHNNLCADEFKEKTIFNLIDEAKNIRAQCKLMEEREEKDD